MLVNGEVGWMEEYKMTIKHSLDVNSCRSFIIE